MPLAPSNVALEAMSVAILTLVRFASDTWRRKIPAILEPAEGSERCPFKTRQLSRALLLNLILRRGRPNITRCRVGERLSSGHCCAIAPSMPYRAWVST